MHLGEIKSSQTKVFVLRSTGYTNAANLVKISLNGKNLNSIGNNESLSVDASPGNNSIVVSMGGLGSIATQRVKRNFQLKPGDKKYFVVNQDMNLIGAELKLYEVSASEFLRS